MTIRDTTLAVFSILYSRECGMMNLSRNLNVVWLSAAASIAAAALIKYDASAYFGSWFYLLLIISVARKDYRWINLSIFLCFNSVAYWFVTGSNLVGLTLTSASAVMGAVSI
jgi:hypothetical protein